MTPGVPPFTISFANRMIKLLKCGDYAEKLSAVDTNEQFASK
jgi:hypothetical protein